ncbi:MAG: hypothetical protein HGA65_01435 [Oscillochloris sp.]|nr:hypothetical protein [Oscillochloris sp.]
MVYDEARGQVVLFGGRGYGGEYLNDTWTWDGNSWTQLNPANSPTARSRHSMAYAATEQRIILFGGMNYDGVQLIRRVGESYFLEPVVLYGSGTVSLGRSAPHKHRQG